MSDQYFCEACNKKLEGDDLCFDSQGVPLCRGDYSVLLDEWNDLSDEEKREFRCLN